MLFYLHSVLFAVKNMSSLETLQQFILEIPEFAAYYNDIYEHMRLYLLTGFMGDDAETDHWIQLLYADVAGAMKQEDKRCTLILVIWLLIISQKRIATLAKTQMLNELVAVLKAVKRDVENTTTYVAAIYDYENFVLQTGIMSIFIFPVHVFRIIYILDLKR